MRTLRALLLVAAAAALSASACGPKKQYTNAEIPTLPDLSDVMWSQAQVMDPQFKKIGRASYTDDDYKQLVDAAERLKLTTAKIKESFSKGPEFNAFADQLAQHAGELETAAQAKDPAKASLALQQAKDTCRACHKKFR